jgi:hypothetical protein
MSAPTRITQQRTEVIRQGNNTQFARLTQLSIEEIAQPNNTQFARMSQISIELMTQPGRAPGGWLQNPLNIMY